MPLRQMGTQDSVLRRQIFVLQKEVHVNYPRHVGQEPSPLIASHMDRPSCHTRILNDSRYFDHTGPIDEACTRTRP